MTTLTHRSLAGAIALMLKPYCLGIMNKITRTPKRPNTIHHLILRRSPSLIPAHFSALIDAIEADRDYWQICGTY